MHEKKLFSITEEFGRLKSSVAVSLRRLCPLTLTKSTNKNLLLRETNSWHHSSKDTRFPGSKRIPNLVLVQSCDGTRNLGLNRTEQEAVEQNESDASKSERENSSSEGW
jgi:hypothetical protein